MRVGRQRLGFTFVEVLVALCVILIALVPLLHLHVNSIRQATVAACTAKAVFLADSKVAETLAQDTLEWGQRRGEVDDEDSAITFQWRVRVSDAQPLELEGGDPLDMRHVHVDVAWQDGSRKRKVSLDRLIKATPDHKDRILDPEDDSQTQRR